MIPTNPGAEKERDQALILERRLARATACIERVRAADREAQSWPTYGSLVRIALAEYDKEAE